jgi:hypothetical protein
VAFKEFPPERLRKFAAPEKSGERGKLARYPATRRIERENSPPAAFFRVSTGNREIFTVPVPAKVPVLAPKRPGGLVAAALGKR